MTSSLFFNGLIISTLFLVVKFIEIRFVTKKEIPPKHLLRDSVIVYISVILGHYLLSQFGSDSPLNKKIVEVFTDSPTF
jgi:hypothetical protein|tara:strand:+ start:437 stop:673 length:237 start_codon:yes stop_codon:yes gene_type:complete